MLRWRQPGKRRSTRALKHKNEMGNNVSEFWNEDNQLPESKVARYERTDQNRPGGGSFMIASAPSFNSMMVRELPGEAYLRNDRSGGSFMLRTDPSFMADDPYPERNASFAHLGGTGSFMVRADSMLQAEDPRQARNSSFMYNKGAGSFIARGDSMMASADPDYGDYAGAALAVRPPKPREYQPHPGDAVDQQLAAFLKQYPNAFARHRIHRKRQGVYELDGRELHVEFKAGGGVGSFRGQSGRLVVHDGPLTQPLADYLDMKESSAVYSSSMFEKRGTLESIPKEYRMTFQDAGCNYSSRVDAMKLAKKQAAAREKAAAMYHGGKKDGMKMKGQSIPAMATGFARPSAPMVTRHQLGPRTNIALVR